MADGEAGASARDHLANERTLLAWVRTALTVIALGFVVDRLAAEGRSGSLPLVGVALVLAGGVVAIGGAVSFLRTRRDLERGAYRSSPALHLGLTAAVVAAALVVAAYLVVSPAG